MLTVADARDAIHGAMPAFPAETVPTSAATGRVLRQVVRAERDQPPFDRVMMDGIALSYADFDAGTREYPVQATQAAGDAALSLQGGRCIEIMTGAALPENADCIVPVERLSVSDGIARIEDGYVAEPFQFVHRRASDHAAGAELLAPGKRISPMDLAVIASCGLTDIEVSQRPVVRVISTGNELVAPGAAIEPHQIRLSNGPAIHSLLGEYGYSECAHDHLVDEPDVLEKRIKVHLDEADVLILSGGVSMGKADYVPGVLTRPPGRIRAAG